MFVAVSLSVLVAVSLSVHSDHSSLIGLSPSVVMLTRRFRQIVFILALSFICGKVLVLQCSFKR